MAWAPSRGNFNAAEGFAMDELNTLHWQVLEGHIVVGAVKGDIKGQAQHSLAPIMTRISIVPTRFVVSVRHPKEGDCPPLKAQVDAGREAGVKKRTKT